LLQILIMVSFWRSAGAPHVTWFETITRSRSVPTAVSSRSDLERLSLGLLQNEVPFSKPVRLLGVSLSSLQHADDAQPQFALPM
jgi:DNA polymerase-4